MINENILHIETTMYEISNWIEIYETKYFSTIFREEGYTQQDYNDLLAHLLYLQSNKYVKETYQKTVYYIPEIVKAIQKIKDNEMVIQSVLSPT